MTTDVIGDVCIAIVQHHSQQLIIHRPHNHTDDIIDVAASAPINTVEKRCRDGVCSILVIFDDEPSKLRDRECDKTTVERIRKILT